MQVTIPTLQTERLALVPVACAHLDTYASLYGDPVVMEHIGKPLTRAEAWKLMASHAGHWLLRGYGGWSIVDRGTGEMVGVTGVQYPDGNPAVEMGWIFRPSSWGRGYATEAATAVLAYAFETVGATRVMARIAPANTGSIAVANKLGMQRDDALSDASVAVYFATRP